MSGTRQTPALTRSFILVITRPSIGKQAVAICQLYQMHYNDSAMKIRITLHSAFEII